ncbi:MAG: osmotically inducible protein C, partial [Candidatus Korarchaeota archaeon]|nr:osmotically inducible protein C [Candidatus Korarchaeota archaeon]
MRARSKLVEGFRSVIDDGRGHSVVTDLPKDMGGTDTAPTALELAVMALAGCITTIFAMVAKGKGL